MVCSCLEVFGLEALLGSEKLWPLLLAITVIPAVLQCILLPFCPESPRFLLINLKQEEQACKGMNRQLQRTISYCHILLQSPLPCSLH